MSWKYKLEWRNKKTSIAKFKVYDQEGFEKKKIVLKGGCFMHIILSEVFL